MSRRTTHATALFISVGCLLASCRVADHRISSSELPPLDDSREPAPPLQLRQLMRAPQGAEASWDALRGNVVLLEFWATWCGPCVAAIPHLNELAETFANERVVFLSITSEDNEPVEQFLERREMKSWIGFDEDGKTHRTYGVTGIPHTVIVDQHGRIAAVTHPTEVTEKVIRNMLAGRDAGLAWRPTGERHLRPGEDPGGDDRRAPLTRLIIRESEGEGPGRTLQGSGEFTGDDVPLRRVIPIAYSMPYTRIDGLEHLGDGSYTIVVNAPRHDAEIMRSLLRQALESTFRFEARREPRLRPVLEVRTSSDVDHKMEPSAEDSMQFTGTLHNEIRTQHVTVANFVAAVENLIGWPLLDETGIDGRFDITLHFDSEIRSMSEEVRIEHIAAALHEQLGLELVEAEREIEVLVIVPKQAD